MNRRWLGPAGILTAVLLMLSTAALLLRRWPASPTTAPPISSSPVLPGPRPITGRAQVTDASGAQSNVLELPRASLEFAGHWGGYTHTAITSVIPGRLTGKTPDRVSIVFARVGDRVFIGSELYSPPNQRLLKKASVRIANPQAASISYTAEDANLYYEYTHSFRLRPSGEIAYRETVRVFERTGHVLAGTLRQWATLIRLDTPQQQARFARPAPDQLPQREVSSTRRFP